MPAKLNSAPEVGESDSKVKVQVSIPDQAAQKQNAKASSDELSDPFAEE